MTVVRQSTTFLDFAGRRKDGTLVQSTVPQFDGSPYAAFNCAASSEAVRVLVETAKKAKPGTPWPPTGATIRAGTGDHNGGLTPQQTAAVSRDRYDLPSDIRILDWNEVVAKLWARYGMTVLVSYRPIANAGYSASPGFYGTHSIDLLGIRRHEDGIVDVLMSDPLRDGRRAGIEKGVVWLPVAILKRATGELDLGGGFGTVDHRYGANKAYISAATEPYVAPPPPAQVVLKYGAHKVRPKRVRVLFARTILRTSPRRVASNHVRLMDKADTFDIYQRVDNAQGAWVGNKAGTRWLYRPGVKFVRYL